MASVLGILAVAILFRSIYHLASRSFYAQQDTRTPLYISFFTIGLNIALAVWFTFGLHLAVYGLAWAAAIVSAVEVAILFFVMSKRIKGLFDKAFIHSVSRMVVAAGLMGVVTYMSILMWPLNATDQSFLASFPKFTFIVVISGITYFGICRLFKLEETRPIISRLKKVIFHKA